MKYMSVPKLINDCKKTYTLTMKVLDADYIFVSSLVYLFTWKLHYRFRKCNLDKVIKIIDYFRPTTISVNFVFF